MPCYKLVRYSSTYQLLSRVLCVCIHALCTFFIEFTHCHLSGDLDSKFLQPISVWQCGQNPATEERIPAGQERRNGSALRRTGLTAPRTRKRHTQGEELRHTHAHEQGKGSGKMVS